MEMYSKLKKDGFIRQRQDNYFSMRAVSTAGYFTSSQLQTILNVADTYGQGYVHITSRQSVAIPFIHLDNTEKAKRMLNEGGVEVGAYGAYVGAVSACQGNRVCPSGLVDTFELASKIETRYNNRELPNKINVGVAGCPNNCVRVQQNDIGIKGGVVPRWAANKCNYCGACAKVCRAGAITVDSINKSWTIEVDKCVNCGRCIKNCRRAAIAGDIGYIIILNGSVTLPIIFNVDEVLNTMDSVIEFFVSNAKRGERFRVVFERDFNINNISAKA